MGRIKSKMIKNAGKELLDGNTTFNTNFENNKKVLSNTMPSKSTRNKVAGYITRLVKMKVNPRKIKPKENLEETPQYDY